MRIRLKYPCGEWYNYHYKLLLNVIILFLFYSELDCPNHGPWYYKFLYVWMCMVLLESFIIILRELVCPTDYYAEEEPKTKK